MKFTPLIIGLLMGYFPILAQSDSIKQYTTKHLSGEPPKIDGLLDDAAWDQVPWGGGDFRQVSPDAGAAPTVQTKFKILYDAKNLYVAVKNLDPDPSKIVSRMSRRDGFEGDWIEMNIDSYYDKRSAFSFTSSVSGVKSDEYVSNNGNNWDANWDPIWYLKTSIDNEGWIAEYRIPLSQLRFADKPDHVWGLQFTRRFFRNQERSLWQYIPPDASGWVHLFGELRGITGVKPQKQLEIQPYVVAKTESMQKEEGNPFATGKSSAIDLGLDAKIGITSDITLDLTVNPDFGQVEADPSQVNLSAFRLFFQERRPFFIEGNNTLNFPITDFNSNNLFYSRRIGRRPQGEIDTDKNEEDDVDEYVKNVPNTTILGAAKLTGKNKKGFSWGILESVTAEEKTSIDSIGYRKSEVIEPLTNYFVARAQQDINKGNTIIGGMFTATNRKITEKNLRWLHNNAYSGGVDFVHNWKDRKYFINVKAIASHVEGSQEAILGTQQASERYFQRPDNNHASVDSTRRSLSGTGGIFVYGKRSGKWIYEAGFNWLTPQLELNDIGFLSQTDQMTQWIWTQYRVLNPKGIFRSQRYNLTEYLGWDFDKRNTSEGYELNANLDFKNFWSFNGGVNYETHNISNADLRGGPALYYPGNVSTWLWLGTDNRKKFQFIISPQWRWGLNNYFKNHSLDLGLNFRPMNALSIALSPSINTNKNKLQYVATGDVNSQDRYIVAEINQTTLRFSLRLTYMLTPNLSIQYWGQPFGTAGKYSKFKYITDADAPTLSQRFTHVPSQWIALNDDDDEYTVNENNDNSVAYTFSKPDFNVGQFRSNMVVRWEYIPGSTLFLVWAQEMNGSFYDKNYQFSFADKTHNTVMMKFTYRFIL
jgi:hypothetical protein